MEETIRILKKGGVVVLPTDTVYGIGCSAFDENAIRRVFELKGRSFNKPIAVLVADIEQAEKFAEISDKEREVMRKYMPGAVTIILKKKTSGVPELLTAGLSTVGVRIPKNEVLLRILRETGPLAVTSANLAGEEPAMSVDDLDEIIKNGVDAVLDGGKMGMGTPSTIVRFEKSGKLNVLRKGPIEVVL